MRISRAMVMITIALLITAVGCTKQVTGTAGSDPNKPPLSVSKDGYGIVAGFNNAPRRSRSTPSRNATTALICRLTSVINSPTTSRSGNSR